jgi:hypothetical protein
VTGQQLMTGRQLREVLAGPSACPIGEASHAHGFQETEPVMPEGRRAAYEDAAPTRHDFRCDRLQGRPHTVFHGSQYVPFHGGRYVLAVPSFKCCAIPLRCAVATPLRGVRSRRCRHVGGVTRRAHLPAQASLRRTLRGSCATGSSRSADIGWPIQVQLRLRIADPPIWSIPYNCPARGR